MTHLVEIEILSSTPIVVLRGSRFLSSILKVQPETSALSAMSLQVIYSVTRATSINTLNLEQADVERRTDPSLPLASRARLASVTVIVP